jgi:Sulfotransferase domain
MIVVIAGMFRSGSTFTFNIVRELLLGEVYVLSGNSIPNEELIRDRSRNLVILSHSPDDALMNKIRAGHAVCICTFRKPEDVIVSWMDTFGFSFGESVDMIRRWLEWRNSAQGLMLNLRYEDLMDRPQRAILMIQRSLFGRIERRQATQLSARYNHARAERAREGKPDNMDAIDIRLTAHDPTMRSHPQHVSNALNATQIAAVREALVNYVNADGEYSPTCSQKSKQPILPIKSAVVECTTARNDAVNTC